jgi:anti-sigma factor RsiW
MTPSEEMTCRELVELVTEYLEGTLPAAERRRFEAHLSGCRHCRAYLAQMRMTVGVLGRLTEADVGADAEAALRRAFRGWKRA